MGSIVKLPSAVPALAAGNQLKVPFHSFEKVLNLNLLKILRHLSLPLCIDSYFIFFSCLCTQ
jgi:hypothetical protein